MNSISETLRRLSSVRTEYRPGSAPVAEDRLEDLRDFGSNPGALRARVFIPQPLRSKAALVVVLHGCTQTAAGYDHGAGWSGLAQKHGFALLYPEQQRANNPNLCFNWFAQADARRDKGEALSIKQMVVAMVAQHRLDPKRIFVTGLSAGGAMTAVMLATYPEMFAGGAVIAGLPYGTAWSVSQALTRMAGQGTPGETELGDAVRHASNHKGPWPTLSVWHGGADGTVSPSNADALLSQWRELHQLGSTPSETRTGSGYRRRTWHDRASREVIEDYLIPGMGHGTPLDTQGKDGCGVSGPHMLDVGLPSTQLIATRWGLIQETGKASATGRSAAARPPEAVTERNSLPFQVPAGSLAGVERTIKDALRAAGLLR